MNSYRPLPRPPKLINFLTKKKKHDNTVLDRSNEGERKRRCHSQQAMSTLSSSPSLVGDPINRPSADSEGYEYSSEIQASMNMIPSGFDLLNQAADWVSSNVNRQDEIRPSITQREGSEVMNKSFSSRNSTLLKDKYHHGNNANAIKIAVGVPSMCVTNHNNARGIYHHYNPNVTSNSALMHPHCSWQQERRYVPLHQLQQPSHFQRGLALSKESVMNPDREDDDFTMDTLHLLRREPRSTVHYRNGK